MRINSYHSQDKRSKSSCDKVQSIFNKAVSIFEKEDHSFVLQVLKKDVITFGKTVS